MRYFETEYGYFTETGDFVITNVITPAPWINILSNGKYGAVYSQVGSGYSFYIDASQSLLTRWIQDLVQDNYGKYYYIVDERKGEIFSNTFQPLKRNDGKYSVMYTPGMVFYHTEYEYFSVKTTVVVSLEYDVEIVRLEFENKIDELLEFSVFSYIELNMGTISDIHREFHKLFFETNFFKNTLLNKKHMWTAGSARWNSSYPFIFFHSTTEKVISYETSKKHFLGAYGDLKTPQALHRKILDNNTGRNVDGINTLQVKISMQPFSKKTIYFLLGVSEEEEKSLNISLKFQNNTFCESQIDKTRKYWQSFLKKFSVKVPDKDIEFLLNKWLPYQAIAGRLMARTAYYQIGGAFGYRDQLQDSLAGLWLDPSITRNQILLHAMHQRKDGSVQHWWFPLNEGSPSERWSDDLLWLPFVVCEYIEHTGDLRILHEKVPFLENDNATVKEHCMMSLRSTLSNISMRGIPLILGGDWNDGLNNLGRMRKGESFWLSEFLYFILKRVMKLFDLDEDERKWIEKSMRKIKDSFNKYAWNGEWFNRATSDDGRIIGGKEDGRIFLNPQNWAIISGISENTKIKRAMEKVKEKLLTDYGPLLLYPPFMNIDEKVGYITRYAPGTRENGGVYTHAAIWTIWAAWLMKDSEMVESIYQSLSPILRYYKNPDIYKAEPYVTPGNSDGPYSPHKGKAGWTWYTGSAGWFYRLMIQCYLGIKPSKDGLIFSPCNEKRWDKLIANFHIRGGHYTLEIFNPEKKKLKCFREILFNGEKLKDNLIPYRKGENYVKILY